MRRVLLAALLLVFVSSPLSAADLPPTVPHPPIRQALGFEVWIQDLNTAEFLWIAPYLWDTPYAENTGWVGGDREAYRCLYAFLVHNGEVDGRVTFVRVDAPRDASEYVGVKDKFMPEGQRYYSGALAPAGTIHLSPGECPHPDPALYDLPPAPDERPVIAYWDGEEVLEIRDYTTVDAAPGVTFELLEEIRTPFQVTTTDSGTTTVNSRVTVLARDNGVPSLVIYYDALGSGSMFPPETC